MKIIKMNTNKTKRIQKLLLLFLFVFSISLSLISGEKQCVWTGVKKIVAIGDIHGDFNNFVKILRDLNIIDENFQWIAGTTHLVQTGDILDRGPNAKAAFDLIKKLEVQAEQAAGKVHMLIGNHEYMNIKNMAFDFEGYVTIDQFLSFLPQDFIEEKEEEFKKKNHQKTATLNNNSNGNLDFYPYWEEILSKKEEKAIRKYRDNFNKNYGNWILEHNAVIKINNIVFTHGGISKKYSKWKLEKINDTITKELSGKKRQKVVYDNAGPLWYRELAQQEESIFFDEVNEILENLDADYMVTAHTPKKTGVFSRFYGRIWMIDTGISSHYGGNLSALIYEDGEFDTYPGEKYEKK
jgi:hypothetical protein